MKQELANKTKAATWWLEGTLISLANGSVPLQWRAHHQEKTLAGERGNMGWKKARSLWP